MRLLTWENWPVLVICAGMLAAAIIDWWKFKVPNKLTYPLILSGWLLGVANNLGLGAGEGGFGAALAGTVLGFLLLLPIYSVGGMGAGDVPGAGFRFLSRRRLFSAPRSYFRPGVRAT